ncbi:hypothetical protein LTS15_011286 [Exophiala xenobiotica]|nr:hypothetical protein LTS15_011286 [Exophiala xenobiotica]
MDFRKAQKERFLREFAENKRQAALFLYQQELAKTQGGEPPKPITAEGSASMALSYLKGEIRTGEKTAEELYRLHVLGEKPGRGRKTRAQREQTRPDRLATLQAEAEARHDARYLYLARRSPIEVLGSLYRTSGPPMPMHKRKRSLDSNDNESSGSHKKRAGSERRRQRQAR